MSRLKSMAGLLAGAVACAKADSDEIASNPRTIKPSNSNERGTLVMAAGLTREGIWQAGINGGEQRWQ